MKNLPLAHWGYKCWYPHLTNQGNIFSKDIAPGLNYETQQNYIQGLKRFKYFVSACWLQIDSSFDLRKFGAVVKRFDEVEYVLVIYSAEHLLHVMQGLDLIHRC